MRARGYLATGLIVGLAMTLAPAVSVDAAESSLLMDSAHEDFYLPEIEGVQDREGFYVYDPALPPDVAVWFARATSSSDPVGIVVPMRRMWRAAADYRGDVGFTTGPSDPRTGRLRVAHGDQVTVSHIDRGDGTTVSESATWQARSRRPDIRQIIHTRPTADTIRVEGAAGAASPGAQVSVFADETAPTAIASTLADADGRFTVSAVADAGPLDVVWVSSEEPGYPQSARVYARWSWLTGRVVLPGSGEPTVSQHLAVHREGQPHRCDGTSSCWPGGGFTNADGRWSREDGTENDGSGPTTGTYYVEPYSYLPGYGDGDEYPVDVTSVSTTTDAGTVSLAPPNFVLRAIDPAGVPVPETSVTVHHLTAPDAIGGYGGRDGRVPLHFGQTRSVAWPDGDYSLELMEPNGCPYHRPDPVTVSVVNGQPQPAQVDVVLEPLAGGGTTPDRAALRPFMVDGTAHVVLETALGAIDLTLTDVAADGLLSLGCVSVPLPDGVEVVEPPIDLGLDRSFGDAEICLTYTDERLAESGKDESALELLHIEGGDVEPITTSRDPARNIVCGTTTSFSAFAVGVTTARACPADTPEDGFRDVSARSVHEHAIDCAVWWSIARGTTTTTYSPGLSVSRAQMASFVARMMAAGGATLPADPPDRFADDEGNVHELAINQLADLGVASGVTSTSYRPAAPVSRAQMASFLVRAYEVAANTSLPSGDDRFSDDNTSIHESRINQAAAAGFATGVTTDSYRPDLSVRRDQMASFVTRVLQRFADEGAATPR